MDNNQEISVHLNQPIITMWPEWLVSPGSWVGHLPFAFWLVDALRPQIFVELGTHTGNSYESLR